jgi:hypothetical protein
MHHKSGKSFARFLNGQGIQTKRGGEWLSTRRSETQEALFSKQLFHKALVPVIQ